MGWTDCLGVLDHSSLCTGLKGWVQTTSKSCAWSLFMIWMIIFVVACNIICDWEPQAISKENLYFLRFSELFEVYFPFIYELSRCLFGKLMSLQRKGITIYFLFCLQGLLYAGNNTIFESTGLYGKVICVLVIYTSYICLCIWICLFFFIELKAVKVFFL